MMHWKNFSLGNSIIIETAFVTLIVYCEFTNPNMLLKIHLKNFVDDVVCRFNNILQLSKLCISKLQLKNHVWFELEKVFNKKYYSLCDYKLPASNNIMMEG